MAGACDITCGLCGGLVWGDGGGGDVAPNISRLFEEYQPDAEGNIANDSICTVLTTTIAPSQGISNTVRWAPSLRLRDYKRSLELWVREWEEVRSYEERSNELTIASDQNCARSYLRTRRPPSPTTAIILTHHPNPFRASLRSSQYVRREGGKQKKRKVVVVER